VRSKLREFGVRKSGPGFYQLMARLEDSGLVEGDYTQQVVQGQIIRERRYAITGQGLQAWDTSRSFYVRAIADFAGDEGLARA